MIVAALGADVRARPLPDGGASVAALTACASSAGVALALAFDLAFAAPDMIRSAPAQMTTAAKGLPTDMRIDEGSVPGSPLRLLHTLQIRFLAPGTAQPRTSSSIPIVSSWCRRRESALRTRTTTASA